MAFRCLLPPLSLLFVLSMSRALFLPPQQQVSMQICSTTKITLWIIDLWIFFGGWIWWECYPNIDSTNTQRQQSDAMCASDNWLAGCWIPIFCYFYLSHSQFMSVIFVRFCFHLVSSWLNFVFLALTPWISDARCLPICVVVAGYAGEWHLFYVFVIGVIYFTFVNRTVILLYLFCFLSCLFDI